MKSFLLFFIFCTISSVCAQQEEGRASFYADKFEGRPTANGETYLHNRFTAAHKTLPFGSKVKVTNLNNGKSIIVRVNDRGPFVVGRVIDLSKSAAQELNFIRQGTALVKLELLNENEEIIEVPLTVDAFTTSREYYNLDVKRIMPKGYGLQIGSFLEFVNLVQTAELLKAKYNKEVTILVKVVNGVKFYSMIIGQFKTRDKAEHFRKNIVQEYSDSFIVDFSKG